MSPVNLQICFILIVGITDGTSANKQTFKIVDDQLESNAKFYDRYKTYTLKYAIGNITNRSSPEQAAAMIVFNESKIIIPQAAMAVRSLKSAKIGAMMGSNKVEEMYDKFAKSFVKSVESKEEVNHQFLALEEKIREAARGNDTAKFINFYMGLTKYANMFRQTVQKLTLDEGLASEKINCAVEGKNTITDGVAKEINDALREILKDYNGIYEKIANGMKVVADSGKCPY